MRRNPPRSILTKALLCLLPAACCVLNGCNIIGAAAQIMPQADIAPEYRDLANQTVGVMVWVDRGVRIDYPNLRADIARGLTTKLMQVTKPRDPKEEKNVPKELAHTEYQDPMKIIKLQEQHPEFEGMPSKDIAVRLGVSRVINIEVPSFETRPQESIDLFKGTLLAKVEVLEVSSGTNGKTAKIAYTDSDMRSVFPPHRSEGIAGPDVNSEYIYRKTVDQFTTDMANKFVTHPQ